VLYRKKDHDSQAFEYNCLYTVSPIHGATVCSKLVVEVLGFTKCARVTSALAGLETPSGKGTSNSKDWYKQTSSSLQ